MNTRIFLLVSLALGAGPGTASAREDPLPVDTALPGVRASVWRQSFGLSREGDALLGAGPDYKVYFEEGGIAFHPALGRRVDGNLPLRFELESVRRGDAAPQVLGGASEPLADGDVVRYQRGAGLIESYELRADGVEQSFTLPAPLPGEGDLVVRGRIATDLAPPPPGEHPDGLSFRFPGIGGVSIGAVTGIDAEGRTAPGSLRFDGAHLELVLPGEFVRDAAYPLVLDPKIGSDIDVVTGTTDDVAPDVAFDSTWGIYLVVWQKEYSGSDVDIYAQRVASDGSLSGGLIVVEGLIARIGMHPTVASVNLTDRYLVAWQEASSIFGPYGIMARAINPTSAGGSSSTVTISSGTASRIDPDAGGEPTLLDDDVLLVWTEVGGGIRGTQVTVPGSGDPFPFGAFTLSGTDDSKPAISRCTDDSGRRLVVWQRFYTGSPGDHDIRCAVIDRNGGILYAETTLILSEGPDEEDPDVDGDGTSWLVVYEREETPGSGDNDIRGRRVTWTGSHVTFGDELTIEGDFNDDEIDPAVAYTGPKYFVAYSDQYFGGLQYDVYAKGLNPTTCEVCESEMGIGQGGFESGVEMASELSGSSDGGDALLIVWHSIETTPPFEGDIYAHRLEAIGAGGSVANQGGGCGDGGSVSFSGALAVGSPDFTMHLSGADSSATFALLLLRPVAPGHTFVCGECEFLLPPGIQLSAPLFLGTTKLKVPVPCQLGLLGAVIDAQWAVLPTSESPCPMFPKISFSDRWSLTLGL